MPYASDPMRLAPLLALCLAAPLAAQTPDPTPPERYYPLAVGDIREYRTTTSSPPRPPSYLRESVVGTTLEDGRTYFLVDAVGYDASGAETSRRTRLLRFDSTRAVPVEREANGFDNPITPCRLDLPFGPPGSSDDCPFYSGSPSETVLGVQTSVKTFVNLIGDARYAAGFGFVSARIDEAGTESETSLYYAQIGGLTYGTPDPILPPPPPTASDFWPLQVGNGWAYETTEIGQGTWRETLEVVSDTLLGGRSYAAVRACTSWMPAGGTTGAWSCGMQFVRADDEAGALVLWAGLGQPEHELMCGLQAPPGSVVTCDSMGEVPVWVLESPNVIGVASQAVAVGEIRGLSTLADPGLPGWAAGFGRLENPVWAGWSSITYARIGDQTYGVFPIADETAPPVAPALALRVAPTPTDGPVTLAVVGAASPAKVEVFDALGRRVWRATVAGETTVDARGWAPGVYVVRATAGDATATTRIVRR